METFQSIHGVEAVSTFESIHGSEPDESESEDEPARPTRRELPPQPSIERERPPQPRPGTTRRPQEVWTTPLTTTKPLESELETRFGGSLTAGQDFTIEKTGKGLEAQLTSTSASNSSSRSSRL